MKRIFDATIRQIGSDVAELSIINIETDEKQTTQLVVTNQQVLKRVVDYWGFPCEEIDYGLWGSVFEELNVPDLLQGIVSEAATHIPGTPEYERLEQIGRDIEAGKYQD